jgi:predicted phosphoribosyltransferase
LSQNIIEERAYREKIQIFKDRFHAGEVLAEKLYDYANKMDVILLAIPAGGVPVGYTIAESLHISFDIVTVRKIQIPWNPEAGFGAVTWDGECLLNTSLMESLGLPEEVIDEAISYTKAVIKERVSKFRGNRLPLDLENQTVILVDDGLASGFTMLVAVKSIRKKKPKDIVIAVPTASRRAIELLASEVDTLVCLNIRSSPLFAVADAYITWYDLSDEEVIKLLNDAWNTT